MQQQILYTDAVDLLKKLIEIPSFSKSEEGTADEIAAFLQARGINHFRVQHNIWAVTKHFDASRPTLLLNSHHDTVKPNPQYTNDPFKAIEKSGRLYGLGSNDAGGCLVSLMAAFIHFYQQTDLSYNLLLAATAEEEISGYNGIELLLKDPHLNNVLRGEKISCAIVGEPTTMQLAVAEKGLMVLDCVAYGKAGHAARNEGENAIYNAMKDIAWFSTYNFDKVSEWLGPVKMSVTVINTENKAHNMVPSQCSFVVDIRITEQYTHEEVLDIIQKHVSCEVTPRSMRLRATGIANDHPLVKAGLSLGKQCYGSPTSSDKALMNFPSLKCGPGDSARSHTADEYIYLEEIEHGIRDYVNMLDHFLKAPQ